MRHVLASCLLMRNCGIFAWWRPMAPTFNDANDRVALAVLGKVFPGREEVGIHRRDLVLGLGTIHSMTQQEPAAS